MNKKYLGILFLIILTGVFFRAYKFSDYLRFNPDQARDARIISDAIDGKEDLPLLGPQAGGTNFKLGAIFYQIQFFTAKIFGNFPDKIAYPDLITSILSIPLLFFFLRKYFSLKISLLSVTLFAVSFYTIKYARFAWNPNSMPFYTLVFFYALSEIVKNKGRQKFLWAIVLGISIGICVQLHSLLLFSLPIVTIIYFAYLFFKKNSTWKYVFLIILVSLFMNTSQIVHEVRTGGENIQAFFKGMENKSQRGGTIVEKLELNIVCHVQSGSFMLTSIGESDQCNFWDAKKEIKKNSFMTNLIFIGNVVSSFIFYLGGLWLLFRAFRKEKNQEKKYFLGTIILYFGILFIILIPLAEEISFRFFLVEEFMPFIFLAFWISFFEKNWKKKGFMLAVFLITIFAILNIKNVSHKFSYFEGNAKNNKGDFEEFTLKEASGMADFIIGNNPEKKKVFLDGKTGEMFKIIKPVRYFTDNEDMKVSELKKKTKLESDDKVFYVDVVNNPHSKSSISEKLEKNFEVQSQEKINRIIIYSLIRR